MARYFPGGTRMTRPAGGHMLWIELPSKVNALKLYRAALEEHISILPGTFFSASGRYRNHIRINCGNSGRRRTTGHSRRWGGCASACPES